MGLLGFIMRREETLGLQDRGLRRLRADVLEEGVIRSARTGRSLLPLLFLCRLSIFFCFGFVPFAFVLLVLLLLLLPFGAFPDRFRGFSHCTLQRLAQHSPSLDNTLAVLEVFAKILGHFARSQALDGSNKAQLADKQRIVRRRGHGKFREQLLDLCVCGLWGILCQKHSISNPQSLRGNCSVFRDEAAVILYLVHLHNFTNQS